MEGLSTEFRLEDPSFTKTVREQDANVASINVLAAGISMDLPRSYTQAVNGANGEEWKAACEAEIAMLRKLKVWIEVQAPKNQKIVSSKWIFANKINSTGQITRRKARFVVRGFSQQEGVDFTETFAPTAKFTSFMILFTIAVRYGWSVKGFDVVAAYPHSPLDEKIYIQPPEGFKTSHPGHVLELRKALYGTKQAARCWWKHFSGLLSGIGCQYCVNDQSLYVLRHKGDTAILWIHVDDGALCGSSERILTFIWQSLLKHFDISWNNKLEQIVGIQVEHTARGIFLSQPILASLVLQSTGFENSKVSTPMIANLKLDTTDVSMTPVEGSKYLSILGSLSYLAIGTRPDIAHTVNYLARFSSRPSEAHWQAFKHLLRYLSGTKLEGILFESGHGDEDLVTFCDASWGGEYSRSTHGFIVFLYGNPISWASRRQSCVATSTCHAEYMALGVAAQESIWIQTLLRDIFTKDFITTMRCDNTAAIKVANDLHLTKRLHHVTREFHYVNEQIHDGNLIIEWIDSPSQKADILTKSLGNVLFNTMKKLIRMFSGSIFFLKS